MHSARSSVSLIGTTAYATTPARIARYANIRTLLSVVVKGAEQINVMKVALACRGCLGWEHTRLCYIAPPTSLLSQLTHSCTVSRLVGGAM